MGGAMSRMPEVPNAASGREGAYSLLTLGVLAPEIAAAVPTAGSAVHNALSPWSTGTVPVNWLGDADTPEDVARAWTPEVHRRLLRIKHDADPQRPLPVRPRPRLTSATMCSVRPAASTANLRRMPCRNATDRHDSADACSAVPTQCNCCRRGCDAGRCVGPFRRRGGAVRTRMSQWGSPDRHTGDKETTLARSDEEATTTNLIGSTSAADRAFGATHRDDLPAQLSPREPEVLALMAEGRLNRAIGEQLTVELKTVETHVSRGFARLGLNGDRHENRRVLAVLTLFGRR